MDVSNWYQDGRLYWLDDPNVTEERVVSFDKVKTYHIPRDYPKMTDEEREIFDEETGGFWRRFFGLDE